MVGDTEQPRLCIPLAPAREASAKGNDENVMHQILEIGARPGQATGPSPHV
jgi:hypothetical protein